MNCSIKKKKFLEYTKDKNCKALNITAKGINISRIILFSMLLTFNQPQLRKAKEVGN